MTEWNTGEITANGVRLHFMRADTGKPPMLLAHGLTDAGACWLPVAEQFRADYDVLMYDARGHGRSEKPADGYTFDTLAADMVGLIGALGLAQPIVIGHSMGAATAALAAARSPALFRAVVLEDPPARRQPAAADEMFFANWRAGLLAEQALSHDALIAKGHTQSPTWSDAELTHWADAKLQVSPNTLEMIRTPGTQWFEHVSEITCPVLLVAADEALGSAVAPDIAAQVQGAWRNGQFVRLAGAGHSVHREAPEAWMQAVRAFLAGV